MAEAYSSNLQIDSRFALKAFALDGNLEKPAWKKAFWVRFVHDMSGCIAYPEAETRVASLWTEDSVYFAFDCRYSTLNLYEGEDPSKERWGLWNRDVVEVFLNPQPERIQHYYELELAPNNLWIDLEIDKTRTPFHDAGWNSGFEHATQINPEKRLWTCEMRVPVRSMGVRTIQPDGEWRVNFYRAEGLGDDSQRRFLAWSTIPEGKTFHVPERFGIIRFVK